MATIDPDSRNAARRAADEQIANEPQFPPPAVASEATPVEDHLRRRRSQAFPAIVENGVIRLLNRGVTLPERSRVIVVAEGK